MKPSKIKKAKPGSPLSTPTWPPGESPSELFRDSLRSEAAEWKDKYDQQALITAAVNAQFDHAHMEIGIYKELLEKERELSRDLQCSADKLYAELLYEKEQHHSAIEAGDRFQAEILRLSRGKRKK